MQFYQFRRARERWTLGRPLGRVTAGLLISDIVKRKRIRLADGGGQDNGRQIYLSSVVRPLIVR